jgi:hypothetical protein
MIHLVGNRDEMVPRLVGFRERFHQEEKDGSRLDGVDKLASCLPPWRRIHSELEQYAKVNGGEERDTLDDLAVKEFPNQDRGDGVSHCNGEVGLATASLGLEKGYVQFRIRGSASRRARGQKEHRTLTREKWRNSTPRPKSGFQSQLLAFA